MRIFGGRDYYDSVQGMFSVSADDPVRFIRNARTISRSDISTAHSTAYKQRVEWLPFELNPIDHFDYSSIRRLPFGVNLKPFEIYFCGRIYSGYRVEHSTRKGLLTLTTYSYKKVLDFLSNADVDVDIEINTHRRVRKLDLPDVYIRHFNPATYKWFVDNKVVLAVNDIYSDVQVRLNCSNLNQYSFQQMVDPFTAYQQLEAWISNDLACQVDGPDIIDDKIKIQKHGFDLKTSFRHPVKVK